jgi:hypothetical protein
MQYYYIQLSFLDGGCYPNNATFMLGYYNRDFTPLQFHEIVSKLIHKMSRASFLKLNNECDFR